MNDLPSEILLLVFQKIENPLTVVSACGVSQRWRDLITTNESALFRVHGVRIDEVDARPVKSLGPWINGWLHRWLVTRTLNSDLRVVDKANERSFHLNVVPPGFKTHHMVENAITTGIGNPGSEIQLRYPPYGVPYTLGRLELGRLDYSAGTVEFFDELDTVGRAQPVPEDSLPSVEIPDGTVERFDTIVAETPWGYICANADEHIAVCDSEFKQLHRVEFHRPRPGLVYSGLLIKTSVKFWNEILIVCDHVDYLKWYEFSNNGKTMRGPMLKYFEYDQATRQYFDNSLNTIQEALFGKAVMGETHMILFRSGDKQGELYTIPYDHIGEGSERLEWKHVLSLYPQRRWRAQQEVTWIGIFPHQSTSRFLVLKGYKVPALLTPGRSYLVVVDLWSVNVAVYVCSDAGTHWYIGEDGCPLTLTKRCIGNMIRDYRERDSNGAVAISLDSMRLS